MATRPIFAIVGQSQRGKSALIKRMLVRFPRTLSVVKTISTRPKRDADDDLFYRLVSHEEFAELKESGVLTQRGETEYAGEFYDNDRSADDAMLQTHAGICAWVEPTVTLYRNLGYRVIMVRIVPDGDGWPAADPKRAAADRKREADGPPPNKFILNAYGDAGFARAEEMLADFISHELLREARRSENPLS